MVHLYRYMQSIEDVPLGTPLVGVTYSVTLSLGSMVIP